MNEDDPVFDLALDDSRLIQMIDRSLQESIDFWNQPPWNLKDADERNLDYWRGEQMAEPYVGASGKVVPNMGNRMQTSSRAVLAYVNARVAQPEVAPSTNSEEAKQFAKDLGSAMYQHSVDNDLEQKVGKATFSLIIQKRGYLKYRFDPLLGPQGDIAIDYVPPEDIVISEDTPWNQEPRRIWQKQRGSVEELVMKFPDKKNAILKALGMQRGVYSQMSKPALWWECWFTYYEDNMRQEGLCWYLPDGKVVLGKMKNPNYIYTGDSVKDRIINYTPFPPKPYVSFSYMNSGKKAIDETSLFEQIKPLQDLYNKRKKQLFEDNDRQTGRTIVDGNALSDEDAKKFFKRGANTILTIKPSDGQSVSNSVFHVPHNASPPQATEEAYDLRNEIDTGMGTPNIFRGEQSKNNTLGQDERIIEQAGALQDDLAKAVDRSTQAGYRLLFQLMKVYYDEDHWFTIKGDTGTYDFVVMRADRMDTNCKISVEAGSTLPANKKEIRSVAVEAAGAGKIDDLSFWEAIVYGKLPDPETIVERTQKQLNDPASFLHDVETQAFNREAATDIAVIIAGQEPPERDEYGQAYLEYFNNFIMSNKFIQIDETIQEALKIHLAAAGATAARTANLQATQADPNQMAGMAPDGSQLPPEAAAAGVPPVEASLPPPM